MHIGNVAELAIRKPIITWVFTTVRVIGGVLAFPAVFFLPRRRRA